MKRHAELLSLSRQHYAALKLARDAKKAAESGDNDQIAHLAQRIAAAYDDELEAHFRIEEAELLPFLARSGRADLARRTLAEHAELRTLVAALQHPQTPAMLRFAELMNAHVRFEERELFEAAQSLLAETGQATFSPRHTA